MSGAEQSVNPTFANPVAAAARFAAADPNHPDRPGGRSLETIVSTPADSLVRVEKGNAAPEELAALTALLLARAAAGGSDTARTSPARSTAGWRRLERTPGFRAPHSWQG